MMSPPTPPQIGAQLVLRARRRGRAPCGCRGACRRFSICLPTPGERAHRRGGRAARAARSCSITTRPSGFTMSEAVLAMKVLGPMPIEVRRCSPTLRGERGLHLARDLQRARGLAPAPGELAVHLVDREHGAHRHHRIDRRRPRGGGTRCRARGARPRTRCRGRACCASATLVPVFTPKVFASTLAAMHTVVSASIGTTPSGLPRSRGSTCCSTEAK